MPTQPHTADWGAAQPLPTAGPSALPEWRVDYFLEDGGECGEGVDEDGVEEGDGVEVVEFVVADAFLGIGEVFEEGG
jgi:hypothetical protein